MSVGSVTPRSRHDHREFGLDRLITLTNSDMEQVNKLILSKISSDVKIISQVANYLVDSGGKRLRPMLTIATAQICRYSGKGHISLAASVEFMHTATLLHDDVVDKSRRRRGKLAAQMLWGNQASVLVGDFLLGQAFRMMVDVGSLAALDVLSTAATVIAKGEVMQLSVTKNLNASENDYLAIIRAKTAALFAAASEAGAIIAGSDSSVTLAFRSYGVNLGLLFQLVDDALDYGGTSDKLGKNIGDDFRGGKVTLPVVLCYCRGTQEEKRFWHRAFELGENDAKALETAITLVNKYDAINDTIVRANYYAGLARDALSPIPNSEHKKALIEVLDFCINRVH